MSWKNADFILLPQRLGILRISIGWRFFLSVAVMAAYMAVSRIIYGTDGLSFAEIEMLRTPFRLVGALLFWLLMADVIFTHQSDVRALCRPSAVLGIGLSLMAALLVLVDGAVGWDAAIIAVTSLPVALNEEFFFRGILQTTLVRRFGALPGISATALVFIVFHIGAGPQDMTDFFLVGLAGLVLGLVYFRTGSMAAVVIFHATYDALTTVLAVPVLSGPWGIILLLYANMVLIGWARTRTDRGASINI